jgi:molybdate transport system substrate-binding protein
MAATEITVLSGGAMRRFLGEAIPLFERDSGHKVTIHYAVTREQKAAIEAGAAFDIALLPRAAIDQLIAAGKIEPRSPALIAHSIVGLMVQAGEPAPDFGTVGAFVSLLRRAKSISYSKGPSGEYVAELLQRLGLAAEMRDKTVFAIGRPVGEVVAAGEAEIGMQQTIENQLVKGAHLAGPLPRELGNFVPASAAAQAFVKFLGTTEAVRIMRAKGLEPGNV